MAVFGLNGWFGSLFFRTQGYRAKLSTVEKEQVGGEMTVDGALQLDTVWSCVRLLSETIGTLPLGLYRKNDKGGRTADTQHPLYALLHDSPNADQTAAEFWEACVACLCLWGNFFAEIILNSSGDLIALNFLRPDLMSVGRDKNGARIYRYEDQAGRRTYSEAEIFHVRGFGTGGDVGLSPISHARKTLNLAADTDLAASSAMRNGTRPGGFLIVPNGATAEQKKELRETFIDPITGPGATAKAGILEKGLDWKEVKGMPPEDMQLLQARGFNVEVICRWFRVPPFMIGHTEKSSSWGTGLEQQMIGFLTFSLRPYLTRIEQAIKKQLLKPTERGKIYAEFILEGLLRADSAGRAAIQNSQAQNGIRTRNELRAMENLEEMEGGDMLTVQSNLVPLNLLGTAGGDQSIKAAFMAWLGIGNPQPITIDHIDHPLETRQMKNKHGSIKVRDFDLQVKAVADDGKFTGYGSVFGVVDSYKEIVAAGAFSESLKAIRERGRPVPVLWQHRSEQPIGIYQEMVEDDHGLKVTGLLLSADVALAKEAHALLKAGAVTGLSIGYWVRESSYDEKTGIRTLTKLDLVEISLVTFPANDDARVDAVKMKLAHGGLPTLSEFEGVLREAGFSKTQAAVIANRGLKHLLDRSESEGKGDTEAAKGLVAHLGAFKLPSF